MDVRAAKDFLVEQTTQQASLERVPLSDLEKRMMYFTESSDATEDPVKLNEEFKSQCNSDEYEKKVSLLLAHAYKRIKNGDAQAVAEWTLPSTRFARETTICLFFGIGPRQA